MGEERRKRLPRSSTRSQDPAGGQHGLGCPRHRAEESPSQAAEHNRRCHLLKPAQVTTSPRNAVPGDTGQEGGKWIPHHVPGRATATMLVYGKVSVPAAPREALRSA